MQSNPLHFSAVRSLFDRTVLIRYSYPLESSRIADTSVLWIYFFYLPEINKLSGLFKVAGATPELDRFTPENEPPLFGQSARKGVGGYVLRLDSVGCWGFEIRCGVRVWRVFFLGKWI